jgi:hypothetical protein
MTSPQYVFMSCCLIKQWIQGQLSSFNSRFHSRMDELYGKNRTEFVCRMCTLHLSKRCFFLAEHHTMKAYWGSGGIARLILYVGDGWRWVVSFRPQPLYPQGKIPWYPWDMRLGGSYSMSGRGGEKNCQPPSGLEHPIIQPVAQRYTTELSPARPTFEYTSHWYWDPRMEYSPSRKRMQIWFELTKKKHSCISCWNVEVLTPAPAPPTPPHPYTFGVSMCGAQRVADGVSEEGNRRCQCYQHQRTFVEWAEVPGAGIPSALPYLELPTSSSTSDPPPQLFKFHGAFVRAWVPTQAMLTIHTKHLHTYPAVLPCRTYTRAIRCYPDDRSSIPDKRREGIFFLCPSPPYRPALWPTQLPIQWVLGTHSPALQRSELESVHWPPSSAKAKNAWSLYDHHPKYVSWR